jgi:myo-inositol-1(or 4)-monophosphatase
MHPILSTAIKAARRAGSVINRAARDSTALQVQAKQARDFVTQVDRAAEAEILEIVRRAYPDHAVLAEESGESAPAASRGKAEYRWLIDPLDGTTNFIHGFPQYSVSIAVQHRGVLSHAVVYDPFKNELFTATRGRGAYLDDRRIRVSRCMRIEEALIGTGFPFKELPRIDRYLAQMRAVMEVAAGVRRAGSAALDLAYVAAGRADGFWELGLSPWDIGAGVLLILEAGGLVTGLSGKDDHLETGDIIAATPKILTSFSSLLMRARSTG